LGKWLYGETLTRHDRTTIDYKVVKKLHAQFHEVAGRVAELAASGHQEEAQRCLSNDFGTAWRKLIAALIVWKKKFR
jgi:methyl-accepting chemotaxis protein